MIEISVSAAKQIRKLLTQRGLAEGGLRVGVKAGGCSGFSYVFDFDATPGQQDEVFEGPEGARIFVDRKSYQLLKGTVLDYDTSLISRGFTFNNPNAKSTCGCGTSFSV
jgi:iron-sulfur cluster assembly protein